MSALGDTPEVAEIPSVSAIQIDPREAKRGQESDDEDAVAQIKALKKQRLQEMRQEKEQQDLERKQAPKKNTAVYISQLPADVTEEELVELFSKYGVIAEDLITGAKKVKLYREEHGLVKGDALIIYLKEESTDLAIALLHDTELRVNGSKIQIRKADFSHKPAQAVEKEAKRSYDADEKKLIQKRLQKLKNKVEDWEGDDAYAKSREEWQRVVVLENVFDMGELERDPELASELEEDMREGCGSVGKITNVVLYNQEPRGVVKVTFTNRRDAEKCVARMNGRSFDGKRLVAYVYSGQQFKRSG
ncbi:hypothetical protein BABINDRAFT_163069 [Babjeviella inositovora NRRL Y-12698]|uniref:RRM domain-containing protein n=1 Tax=Babjeviella inositovora NRRL Y-12698 TaxID=984486 RepID=A0A1E3QK09_9ASCO|nr:uncharacterized protein BABINDRAFT_163069 [Babjeviella inositovora NRRL Y-12698]ODQ78029.1 hypothetical protein BABINDRAFT_163069 [Babjeviella inositovora NRRL Y-12698]